MGILDQVDLTEQVSAKEEVARLTRAGERLLALRLTLGGQLGHELGPPVCVVFEGWDAAGKGGAIKRLVGPLDPRHVRVTQVAAPTYDEKRHHFLWRFWPQLPGWGGMTVFDRSWYGRVLVERVEGFATDEQWGRAYEEIVDFERTLCAEGMVLVKLWLQISHGEQERRFKRRAADPLKSWKLNDEDWRNRAKRAEYEQAIEDMLERTDHADAPWVVVSAEQKRNARVRVLEETVRHLERGMARWDVPLPPPDLARGSVAAPDDGHPYVGSGRDAAAEAPD
ncbi:MAG: UDP-galactose-lipid carrier transferase [Acidimicrobiia bacterium]|nr:UDP-galactose-lipid carrier transferase [Acidimicrobiia bacterium]